MLKFPFKEIKHNIPTVSSNNKVSYIMSNFVKNYKPPKECIDKKSFNLYFDSLDKCLSENSDLSLEERQSSLDNFSNKFKFNSKKNQFEFNPFW